MKKILMTVGAIVLGAALAGAQSGRETVSGYLVDQMCALEHAHEGEAYAQKHDKKCLLMESCIKSGYSVITADGKVVKFDAKGSAMALELIKKTERTADWKVEVAGTVSGDTIAVASLTLQ